MPRRGEHTAGFPTTRSSEPALSRVGVRQVTVPASGHAALTSATVILSFDPSPFHCARLAAELADEWVELVYARRLRGAASRHYLSAMNSFLAYVDAEVSGAESASLAESDPDLHRVVTEWTRLLPSRYRPGSRTPGWFAGRIRALIARRAEHPDRPVVGHLNGWINGAVGVHRGGSTELDEFSRADKGRWSRSLWVRGERPRRGFALAARRRLRAPTLRWPDGCRLLICCGP